MVSTKRDPDDARIPLVLWSGGLDSSYLVLRELMDGDVDVLEVSLMNTFEGHSSSEAKARDRIADKLKEFHEKGILKGVIRNRLKVEFSYPIHPQHQHLSAYGQQPAWLFCAFLNYHPACHSHVLSGILMSDTLAMSGSALKAAWEALQELSPMYSNKKYYYPSPKTPFELPLLYACLDKEKVWQGYDLFSCDSAWKELRSLTWHCCKPKRTFVDGHVGYDPCMVCDSCKAYAAAVGLPFPYFF